MTDIAIKVENLNKIYKNKDFEIIANSNINLVVKKGEIVGVLGENGAGKSTLIKQIIGYLSPSSGSIEILGETMQAKRKSTLNKIGYMMQSRYSHWDHLTVEEALYYSGKLKKLKRSEILNQIEYFLDRLNLENERNRDIKSLSGGKRQAAALACSIIGFPEIIILDEPTNGLDPAKRILLWNFLKELNEEKNSTILIITHNISEIEEIAHQIVIVGEGKVLISGTPEELKSKIDNQIRIELELYESVIVKEMDCFREYIHTWSPDNSTLFLYTSPNNMMEIIERIFQDVQISEYIKNIKIHKSTLEDIYIKIMGQKIINNDLSLEIQY